MAIYLFLFLIHPLVSSRFYTIFFPLLFLFIPFFSSTCQFPASFPFLLRLQRLNYFLPSQQAWTMKVGSTEPSCIWQLITPPYGHGWFSENKSLDGQAMKVSHSSSLPSFRERIYVHLLILPVKSTYADFKLRPTVSVAFTPSRECIKFTYTSAWTCVTETEIFVIRNKSKHLSTVNLSPVSKKKKKKWEPYK
jgi:hypothetical protein